MVRSPVRLLALLLANPLAAAQPPEPAPGCLQERIAQVSANAVAIDGDGDRVPFISQDDPLGTNPGHLEQVFLWREGLGFDRLKGTNRARQLSTDAAGRRIAFVSPAPITPGNAHGQLQVFLWDETTGTRQITDHEADLDEVFESSLDASGTRIAFVRLVHETPVSNPVRHDLVLWEEGVGERVVVSTEGSRLDALSISGDGRRVAFLETPSDITDPPTRLRLWSEATGEVETLLEAGGLFFVDLSDPAIDGDGDRIAFSGQVDPLGTNPDRGSEVFLWDEADGLRQLTDSASGGSFRPSISDDGRAIAFTATTEHGTPNDPVQQAFLWREGADGSSTVTQVTAWPPGPNPAFPGAGAVAVAISGDGRRIAHSRLHPGFGDEVPGIEEVWISDCGAPAPPFDEWLRSPEVPGFEVQVRIGGEREGAPEPLCIPETLCVSGALPGRSEVFVRIVGPKPNGRLWPTLVKFTTSEVEVWIRQLATGEVEHYSLRGASPGFDELPGLFDREGFPPPGS